MRNYGIVAGLAHRHRVHLLSFLAPGDDLEAGPLLRVCETVEAVPQPVRGLRERLWTTLTSPLPDMAHRLASATFGSVLEAMLQRTRFDVVQFEGIEMAPYLLAARTHCPDTRHAPRLVFDDHNAEYVLQRRVFETDIRHPRRWPGALYSLIQWQKLKAYEARACREADVVVAVSGPDAQSLRNIEPSLTVLVVPNGIDLSSYESTVQKEPLPQHSLVFTGKMDFRPNVDAVLWFAHRVLPLIQDKVADVHFYVVGQRPHPRLQALKSQPHVTITGRVPDTRPYIGGAAVYVIPLRSGGGTRFKVLEAMAMRRAIVSTSMGCDGFPVTPGREVILADEPEAFASEVVKLLGDAERRSELGTAGRAFAERYDWSALVPRLEAAYAP